MQRIFRTFIFESVALDRVLRLLPRRGRALDANVQVAYFILHSGGQVVHSLKGLQAALQKNWKIGTKDRSPPSNRIR